MVQNFNLTNDYLFKRTFGYVRTRKDNQNIFKRFVSKENKWNIARQQHYNGKGYYDR